MNALAEILPLFRNQRLLILGDLMLDRYTSGCASRICPEAPVLVLNADATEERPGGAASVASLVSALGAAATVVGVIGNDADGAILRRILARQGIDDHLVFSECDRPTTTKHRFLGGGQHRQAQQIVRVDREVDRPLGKVLGKALQRSVLNELNQFDAVLISDYAKGVCTPELLCAVIEGAARANVPVIVDPARIADYRRYRGANLLTPNRYEAELATGLKIATTRQARWAGQQLCSRLKLGGVLVTLDRDGMAIISAGKPGTILPTRRSAVCDVTGAGDTVLAVIGLALACGAPVVDGARLANLAAGIQVERLGVAPITQKMLRAELAAREKSTPSKLVGQDVIHHLAESYRQKGQSIVFTNGCFDLLHAGHVRMLEEAAGMGDVLVVAINSDASIRRLKGVTRPVVSEIDRARVLAALTSVDHVVISDDDTPHELLRAICPSVLVKGGTYTDKQVVGREIVLRYGGQVAVTGCEPGRSTSTLIQGISEMSIAAKSSKRRKFPQQSLAVASNGCKSS